jgi:hypothetical protein
MECELKEKLEDLPDLAEWLDVGGEVPAGRCPSCGALAYLERADNKVIPHLKHIGQLEVAYYGPINDISSVTVECTACGEVVQELFNADFESKDLPEGGIRSAEQQEELADAETTPE